jgi:catalase
LDQLGKIPLLCFFFSKFLNRKMLDKLCGCNVIGDIDRHEGGIVSRAPPRKWSEQDDYVQPKMLWQNMSEEDQEQTAKNIAGHIQGAKDFIIQRQLGIFRKCDPSLADKVEEMLSMKKKSQDPYTMVA